MNTTSVRWSMQSPLERVRTLNASLEKVLEARVIVIRKGTIHWVSALLHRPPYFPQPDTPPSAAIPR